MILDDGGDATMLVHKGTEWEAAGQVPSTTEEDSEEFGVFKELVRETLKTDPQKWTTVAAGHPAASPRRPRPASTASTSWPRPATCSSRRSTSTTRSPRASSTTSTAAATRSSTASTAPPTSSSAARSPSSLGFGDVGKGCAESLARPGRPRHRHRGRPDLRAAGRDGGLPGRPPRRRRRDGGHLHHLHRLLRRHHRRADAADEEQGDRGQHRPLRQRDRHGRPGQARRASRRPRSSRRCTSGPSPTATRSSCCPRAA